MAPQEKLACIPEPFQSPITGFGWKSTAAPYFTGPFENVTSRPNLVTALGSALDEDLEFPLTCHLH